MWHHMPWPGCMVTSTLALGVFGWWGDASAQFLFLDLPVEDSVQVLASGHYWRLAALRAECYTAH
jgi:hypothetical protein